jgi:hypothetical protein
MSVGASCEIDVEFMECEASESNETGHLSGISEH